MQFEDVIGHTGLKSRLKEMINEGRISHALMFTGNEGSGNLAMALAFGSYLLAKNSQDFDASMIKCEKLVHPDFHFCYPINKTKKIAGSKIISKDFISEWREAVKKNPYMASGEWLAHLGIANKQGLINVEQAREILKDLSLKPYESEYKIMLIWLPEKMNNATANKLLKILEEPPQKTVFLLVSQNPEQLMATIQSRVQMVHVKPIEQVDLRQALEQNFSLNSEEAETISKISQGNYLEAQKLVGDNEIRQFNQEMFVNWMRYLWQKEFLELMQWSEIISKLGRERLMLFFRYGLHVFRESLIMNYAESSIQMTGGSEKAFITKFSPYVNQLNAIDMIELFEEAEYHISRNANPRILLMDVSLKMMKLVRKKVK
jgi:DNA polymerase-3 subunit delta'